MQVPAEESPDKGFTTNVVNMWLCAVQDLPQIANVAATANQHIAGAANDSSAFAEPGVVRIPGGGSTYRDTIVNQVYPAWDQLRDAVQRVLARSVENIYASADALITMAQRYAASDSYASKAFPELIDNFLLQLDRKREYWEAGDREPVTEPD